MPSGPITFRATEKKKEPSKQKTHRRQVQFKPHPSRAPGEAKLTYLVQGESQTPEVLNATE